MQEVVYNLVSTASPSEAFSVDVEKSQANDAPAESPSDNTEEPFDYAYVNTTARVAIYDDLRSAPRVIEIHPAETSEYIERLSSCIYDYAHSAGGPISYTVIREVAENFIHARFKEIVVSVLDHGCTIRFADQGPGIAHKENAQLPGFSSAIEPMKKYIRGVGSGLPIVREYLESSHGTITIEDNMGAGSVVTISVDGASPENNRMSPQPQAQVQPLAQSPMQAQPQTTPQPAAPYSQPQAAAAPQYESAPSYAFGQSQPYAQTQYAPASEFPQPQFQSYPNQPAMPYDAYFSVPQTTAFQPHAQNGYVRGAAHVHPALAALSAKERDLLPIFLSEGVLGITELCNILDIPNSSLYNMLKKLEEAGLLEKTANKKRMLTSLGMEVAQSL
ncbi:MAG: ATP-binding protein [Eggerthellaceae bacterium]|nr:ATP-binding protein [Eggerthellaceae bacterium]